MARYVFFPDAASIATPLAAAKKAARAHGATVVRTSEGAMLLDAPPAKAAQISQALSGWHCSVERKTTRIPERTPLSRAKMMGTKA